MSATTYQSLRSLLYVPANVERFVSKAHERGADAIILDLEDAVAESKKDQARTALKVAVPAVAQSGATVFVRINAGPRRDEDARAAVAAGAKGIVLPKAATTDEIDELVLTTDRADLSVIGLIETAAGMFNAQTIAAHPNVCALSLGAEDFATSTGAKPHAEVIRLPKLLIHYAAKAENKLSLGLLRSTVQFEDEAGLVAAAEEAARFGFDGASCIHPKAVPILNTAFTPSTEEVDYARRVIAAAYDAHANGLGAFMLDGNFIDAPIVSRAYAILAKADKTKEVHHTGI